MSPGSIKASSLYSEAKMVDCTRVKFDVPIGTWGQTQVEVEYPWHRDLDSIILPLLETAHEQQAERQRKHRSEGLPMHKSHSKKSHRGSAKTERNDSAVLPMRPNEDIKLYLKGFESARDLTTKRGETFQTVLEQYAQQMEKDVERLELFHKGKHVGRSMTPDTASETVRSCRSMSSLSSSATSTQSRELRRRSKKRSRQRVEEPERGSILVGNDISGESSQSLRSPWYSAPSVPEKNPLRNSHCRNASWTSIGSNSSDKALKLLGIDANELQHLAHIDSVVPLQHYASGSVTQIDLQPGPSRTARQHEGSISVESNKAYEILGATVEETLRHLDLQTSTSDVNSIHDSLSPIEPRRYRHDSQGRAVTIVSTDKARRMLGVDRPDSDPGPGGRQRTVHADYAFKTRSYPSAKPVDYPTSTSSSAYPEPLNCKRFSLKPDTYRRPEDLIGATSDDDKPKRKSHPAATTEMKRNSVIVPFAEDADRESDDIKLTTTCSGPNTGYVDPTDESMEPEHAIQYSFRGTVAKRCPRMSGIIENCSLKRTWSA
ncbi:hypothetical protein CB0940_11423 [Cercospora beticola]|uniref:Uncharacterized protein n=2 Tax=Cercospora beticola TaxID=122368 RepID=A0A2G5HDV0_CERBT|nr:hypothetical protein CB0940_11423 [Cercospora beticola]PIA90453.1 hypothetical protein CB0940_11423 [Cercospora beticola]CAK1367845.1 unnamed protein product [Cercospora beticola]